MYLWFDLSWAFLTHSKGEGNSIDLINTLKSCGRWSSLSIQICGHFILFFIFFQIVRKGNGRVGEKELPVIKSQLKFFTRSNKELAQRGIRLGGPLCHHASVSTLALHVYGSMSPCPVGSTDVPSAPRGVTGAACRGAARRSRSPCPSSTMKLLLACMGPRWRTPARKSALGISL